MKPTDVISQRLVKWRKWLLLSSYFFQKTDILHKDSAQSTRAILRFPLFNGIFNLSKSLISFRLLVSRSHLLGPRFEMISVPWYTMFIRGLGLLDYRDFCLSEIYLSWGALTYYYWFYTFQWLKLGDFVYGSRQNHLLLIIH